MGQAITSATDLVSYAGDLRRFAKQADARETAQKLQRTADAMEKTGLAKLGQAGPGIGRLLDTLA